MAGIAVCEIDTAGSVILPGPNTKITYNGFPLAVQGCKVQAHGKPPHDAAYLLEGSTKVFIDGAGVVLEGMKATCGDVVTGRPNLTSVS